MRLQAATGIAGRMILAQEQSYRLLHSIYMHRPCTEAASEQPANMRCCPAMSTLLCNASSIHLQARPDCSRLLNCILCILARPR